MIVTPDPHWHDREWEPAPTGWCGPGRWWDDTEDPERAGSTCGEAAGSAQSAARTTDPNTAHS
jgi:hypothetical protein